MTAAHCFFSTSGWRVSLGRQNLQGTNPNEVSTTVARIIIHPNYNRETNDNDIALLRLSSPVEFTDFIRPVCLAASGSVFNNGTDSWVTGWGTVQEGEPLPFPATLQEVEVPVLGNRQCNCLNGVGTVTDNMICAGLLAGGKDSCQGDSGGPMVSKQGPVWVQSGIVSFGFGCARPNLPGVYSRVSSYQSWIDSLIDSDKPGFVRFTSNGMDADSSFTCLGLPPPVITATAVTAGPTTTTDSSASVSSAELCGITPLNTRIVGGEDAPPGSWPWQVSLQRFGSHICGGSLINRNWVMTAAHCFFSTSTSGWRVSLGRQNLQGTNPNEVSTTVARIIIHPNYNRETNDNDIALLRLSSPVEFTDFIRPVCLAASGSVFNNGTDSWVTGWGTVQEGEPLPFPATLQEVEVPVLGNRQCNCLNGVGTVTDNMICAGLLAGGKDSCQGDSGGPMVSKQGPVWVQSGIVSFGFGCARPNLPGVYSRVSSYQSWIDSLIDSDKPGFVRFTSNGMDADSSFTCLGLPPPVITATAVTAGPTTTTDSSASVSSAELCGITPLNTRIVGGEDAPPGSWPWQVSLQRFGSHICGGSLINRNWVMTAAHCFFSTSGWRVSLGRQNLQGTNPNEVSTTVARIIIHPNYNRETNDNDIALLRLSSPVEFTDFIRPVCLAASGSVFNNGTDSWVTGWGTVQEGEPLPFPATLQEVEVPVLGNRQCNCLNGVGTVTDNMICAGLLAGGKDSCQGDSGGPMVSKQGPVWVQSGIVSFGFGCARPNLPGVYSRVSSYQSWIDSLIDSDKPGFVRFTSNGMDADSSFTCLGLPPPVITATAVTAGPTTTTDSSASVSSAELCGITPLNTRIVGGEDAPPGSWPWQVSLQRFGSHICGGSLINRNWVMTAAHCFFSTSTSGWRVSLGRQNLQGTNPNEVSTTVARIIIHPNYNRETNDNDIALLRLSSPVEFTDFIRPVCLAASGSVFNNGTDSWVTGWGTVQEGEPLPFPATLQEVEVPVLGNRQCNCLNGVGTVTDNMICAGLLAGGKDSCQGDSGGPMVSKQGPVWVQSGIVSFGFGCARPNLPGVYSRVSSYQSWIDSLIDSDKPGFVRFTSNGMDADSSFTCLGLPLPFTSIPTIPERAVCGFSPMKSHKVGNNSLESEGNWPWIVSLHKNGAHTCGGSLITDTFVLTSDQCFSNHNPDVREWKAFLGRKHENGFEEFEMSVNVEDITVSKMPGSNIALVQLDKPVSYSDYIQPVCLDMNNERSFPVGSQCWVAGWGRGIKSNENDQDGSGLRELESQVACCGKVSDSENICTHTMDLQQGDTGSPLLCSLGSTWFQVAIVTRGGSKSANSDIQVFAKTSRFESFLKETVSNMPSAAAATSGNAPGFTISFSFAFTITITSVFLLSWS
ncbi:transmembrane protease serine 9-like [Echeneis naucrates]|uniref:transmembrane protease serine 9-like n=1 Tax=Echeneis naucrates TaxID=173247 RepID=UPI0011137B45|nr:transmembrane protease serine 9-like [Echeneis naucrates]